MATKNLGLLDVHSVHFAVHDLEAASRFYLDQLGFSLVHRSSEALVARSGQRSAVFAAGTARICVSQPTNSTCKAARFLELHPEGVMSVAFRVSDLDHAFKTIEQRGGTPINEVFRDGDYR